MTRQFPEVYYVIVSTITSSPETKKIPEETVGRLFPYLRALMCLMKEGVKMASSSKLAELSHTNPSIVRKDLAYFGDFGTRGVGYDVENLNDKIRDILDLQTAKRVALIGVGNIGKALLSYSDFELEGFRIVVAFDKQRDKIGRTIKHITVEDVKNLEKRIRSERIQVAILAVPEQETVELARRLNKAGVKSILSFAPCQLKMPKNLRVTCVDMSTEMARLVYYSSGKRF